VRASLAFLALVGGCSPLRGQTVQVPRDVQRIVLTVDTGSVTLLGAPAGGLVQIERTTRAFPESRAVHDKLERGVLRIDARCGGAPGCRIDHELRVPPNVAVELHVGDGDVELGDLGSNLQIEVALGKVTGGDLRGAEVDVRTEGGAIDLIFASPPRNLVANAAAGDVSLRVPQASYRCDVDPSAELAIRCDPQATHTIAASTGVGKLRIRGAGR
jgi:hypothetical protein